MQKFLSILKRLKTKYCICSMYTHIHTLFFTQMQSEQWKISQNWEFNLKNQVIRLILSGIPDFWIVFRIFISNLHVLEYLIYMPSAIQIINYSNRFIFHTWGWNCRFFLCELLLLSMIIRICSKIYVKTSFCLVCMSKMKVWIQMHVWFPMKTINTIVFQFRISNNCTTRWNNTKVMIS